MSTSAFVFHLKLVAMHFESVRCWHMSALVSNCTLLNFVSNCICTCTHCSPAPWDTGPGHFPRCAHPCACLCDFGHYCTLREALPVEVLAPWRQPLVLPLSRRRSCVRLRGALSPHRSPQVSLLILRATWSRLRTSWPRLRSNAKKYFLSKYLHHGVSSWCCH